MARPHCSANLTLRSRGSAMSLLLLLLCCTGEVAPPPPSAAVAPPPPPPTAEKAEGEHGHGAKHGGIQKELEGMHIEGLAMGSGVMFYITDGNAAPLPLEGITGTAVIKGPSGVEQVQLVPMGDHLHAPGKLVQGQPATVVVTLTRAGKAQSTTFDIPSVGLEAHNHVSLHGGQVSMWGDYHVEYVGKDDVYQFWLTDASREIVKAALSGVVKDGAQQLPLTLDPSTGRLSAKAEGAGSRPVTVELKAGETSFSLGFGPSDAPTEHSGHAHGAGAH